MMMMAPFALKNYWKAYWARAFIMIWYSLTYFPKMKPPPLRAKKSHWEISFEKFVFPQQKERCHNATLCVNHIPKSTVHVYMKYTSPGIFFIHMYEHPINLFILNFFQQNTLQYLNIAIIYAIHNASILYIKSKARSNWIPLKLSNLNLKS